MYCVAARCIKLLQYSQQVWQADITFSCVLCVILLYVCGGSLLMARAGSASKNIYEPSRKCSYEWLPDLHAAQWNASSHGIASTAYTMLI